jgi:hypothetical protein
MATDTVSFNQQGLELLQRGKVEEFNQRCQQDPDWQPHFGGADLGGADLSGANLCRANLGGVSSMGPTSVRPIWRQSRGLQKPGISASVILQAPGMYPKRFGRSIWPSYEQVGSRLA